MAQQVKDRKRGTEKAKPAAKRNARSGASLHSQPKASVTSRIRPIGNSKGVILSNRLMEAAGITSEADIIIQAAEGMITIKQAKPAVNTDLSTWDAQFKAAARKGIKPEKDLFGSMHNSFDETEW
jgi:antitoxin component of MazEF toxin-antitoxin module